jgi:hypothetical protein
MARVGAEERAQEAPVRRELRAGQLGREVDRRVSEEGQGVGGEKDERLVEVRDVRPTGPGRGSVAAAGELFAQPPGDQRSVVVVLDESASGEDLVVGVHR